MALSGSLPQINLGVQDENVERVREIVSVVIDAITSELGISYGSILHDDLKINNNVFLRIVSKMLSPEEKEMKVNMSRDLIDMTEKDIFSKKIMIGDETWGFLNNPHTQNVSQVNAK
ncbi:hypothetical protein TNCV_2700111 [Trichonephila clavipes]|nr:hypothetical protein TNCV_2700111 [Trichonephila clavipes]